jgi:hypothetical protein
VGDKVPVYQSRRCHKVECFNVEYFQEGVQNLMCVNSPTTKCFVSSLNNSLVIIFKQKAKEKFCASAMLYTIKELSKCCIYFKYL